MGKRRPVKRTLDGHCSATFLGLFQPGPAMISGLQRVSTTQAQNGNSLSAMSDLAGTRWRLAIVFLSTYAVYLVVHILGLNGYHSWTLGFVAKVICMPLQGKTDLLVSCSLWMCALRIVFWHSFCCRIFQLLCFCLAAGYANR